MITDTLVQTRSTRTTEAQLSKIINIQNPQPITGFFTPTAITNNFVIKSRLHQRKERPNRSTSNGDMVKKAECDVVSLWHLSNYREAELLKMWKKITLGKSKLPINIL